MIRINNHLLALKLVIVFVSVAFAAVGFAANANPGRVIPKGTVQVLRDGKVVGEFTQEAPLPQGSLLKCTGQCTVRMNDVYMVAESDTVFSVTPTANSNELLVQEGTVYFSVNESSRPLQFNTPSGVVTTRQTSVADSELRGYVRVSENEVEVGVIEGGTMVVDTPNGKMAIMSGKQVTLTLVEPVTPAAASTGGTGSLTMTNVALGAVGTAVLVGGAYAINEAISGDGGGGGGGGGDGSPSSP